MLWNIEGLRYVLQQGAGNYFSGFDILLLNETFQLQDASISKFYCFEQLAAKELAGRPIGGIVIAVVPQLKPKLISKSKYHVAVETDLVILVCFYFSPDCDAMILLDAVAEQLCTLNVSKPSVFCGDFNARIDSDGNEKATFLIYLMNMFGFHLRNDQSVATYFCHNGCSTIDLVFTNVDCISFVVENVDQVVTLRKHVPVKFELVAPTFVEKVAPSKRRSRSIGSIDAVQLPHIVSLLGNRDIDLAYEKLCQVLLAAVPCCDNKPKRRPINRHLQLMKWRLISMHKRLSQFPNQQLLYDYSEEKRKFKDELREYQQSLASADERRLVVEAEQYPWKLNSRRNGSIIARIGMEEWSNHFSNLYDADPMPSPPVDHDYLQYCCSLDNPSWFEDDEITHSLNTEFTEDEVLEVLSSCANKKAVGRDEIANEHLKGSFSVTGYVWILLFNCILTTGKIVESWRNCIVKVLYKGKGDVGDPNSYRGIAFLSHPYKLFTKLLAKRIYDFVDLVSLPNEQYGFRKKRSTFDAIAHLRNYVLDNLQQPGRPVYAIFVDFKKAFDLISRKLLIRKLVLLHGLKGKILRVLISLLEYNLIQVCDGISVSDDIHQTRGVQQGDSLSPLLFMLFIADLPEALKSGCEILSVLMFADDLVFYSTNKFEVQNALNNLAWYCQSNLIEVNLNKTKVVKFRRTGTKANENFVFNGNVVALSNSYEYLGMTLQCTWNFTKHLKLKRVKAFSRIHSIKNLSKLSLQGAANYFRVMIEPILTYGIHVIWQDLTSRQLEILDAAWCDFYKKVLGVPRSCRNRKIIAMVKSSTLVESLVSQNRLPQTPAYIEYIDKLQTKLSDIDFNFFNSPALTQTKWQDSNYEKRHLVCRLSCHGFHHKICLNKKCIDMCNDCICKFCMKAGATLLHALSCEILKDKGLGYLDTVN